MGCEKPDRAALDRDGPRRRLDVACELHALLCRPPQPRLRRGRGKGTGTGRGAAPALLGGGGVLKIGTWERPMSMGVGSGMVCSKMAVEKLT